MATARYLTLEEFEALGREFDPCELWDGQLWAHEPAAFYGGIVSIRIAAALDVHMQGRRLGWIADSSTGYLVERKPPRVLAPDVSFVLRERLPTIPRRGFAPLAPDLAVEVQSPSDSWPYVLQRGGIWIAHGVSVVWLIDPLRRRAVTMRPVGAPEEIGPDGRLSAAPVLPDLSIAIADLCEGIEPAE